MLVLKTVSPDERMYRPKQLWHSPGTAAHDFPESRFLVRERDGLDYHYWRAIPPWSQRDSNEHGAYGAAKRKTFFSRLFHSNGKHD